MLQIFGKNEWKTVDEWSGLQFFYNQILTGDRADNIIGLYRVGPVKATKMLSEAKTEQDLWEACVKAYDGDVDRVEGEIWQPPVNVEDTQ
jgi:5'-3' exonuclease